MELYIPILSAILTARLIEWSIVASAKTYKDHQEKKLIEKVERFNRSQVNE
jgi:hypothetical protein